MSDNFDVQAVVRRIAEENREELRQIEQRRLEARKLGLSIAAAIRAADPEVRAVWGFGSTWEESRPYRLDSDIDLAIEGGDILGAWSLAEHLALVHQRETGTKAAAFSVDVVDLRDDPFSRLVREWGIRLA